MVELLQAIKEKSVTLDTIRHAPHPLCKSPPAQISGETHANADEHTDFLIPEVLCLSVTSSFIEYFWMKDTSKLLNAAVHL